MNTTLLAAELTRRLPALAADSAVNAETVIKNLLDEANKDRVLECVQGKTLRDEFAMAALAYCTGGEGFDFESRASWCYAQSDAMMEQRKL